MAKTKQPKALPEFLGVEFKNQSGQHTGTILEDRGLFWKVRDEAGEEYQVKKTSIKRQFQLEEVEEDLPAPAGTLSASLAGLLNPTPAPAPAAAKAEPKSKDKDPDLVTLADLCTECGIVGRIARRRLRKAYGVIGTGDRWEWRKTDPKLAAVRALLTAKADAEPAPAPAAE